MRRVIVPALYITAFVSALISPVSAIAQDTPCVQVIDLAERYYEQNRMQEVIALVTDCLSDEDIDNATAVRGYRLLALAYLRSDQLADAKLAIIELLGRKPDYVTDPVQDLPAYTGLVNNIKVQLALQANEVSPPAVDTVKTPVSPPADPTGVDYRPQDRVATMGKPSGTGISFRLRVGWSSYGGERGNSGNGFFDEFADNGGVAFATELGFDISEYFSAGFQYELGHYDNMLVAKGSPPDFPTIAIGNSSPWLHYVGVFGRGYVPTGGIARPYGQLGYLASFGLLNNKVGVGSGPKFTIGLDIAVDDNVGIYAEIEEHILLPGTATDLVDRGLGYDLFSGAGIGVRYTLDN